MTRSRPIPIKFLLDHLEVIDRLKKQRTRNGARASRQSILDLLIATAIPLVDCERPTRKLRATGRSR